MTEKNLVLNVENYSKNFVIHEQNKVIPSANNLSLKVYSGALTAIIGQTGSGKSSVLKGIYRTYLPDSGAIYYTNKNNQIIDLATANDHEILKLRRQEISFVTQFLHCLPRQSTEEVICQPLIEQGETKENALLVTREILTQLNLPERLWGISPATFSGGEKQRVNFARGLVTKPRLLLLDEPTASLDPNTTDKIVTLIDSLKKQSTAILAIFHQPELVERLADHVISLKAPNR